MHSLIVSKLNDAVTDILMNVGELDTMIGITKNLRYVLEKFEKEMLEEIAEMESAGFTKDVNGYYTKP